MNSATFHTDRLTGIGGSQVHHLFSLPPYGCSRQLMYEKLQVPPDYPVDETGPMRRGNKLEPIIAEEYAEATGRKLESRPMLRHPEHEWAVVHVDRIVDSNRVLEVKSVGREVFAKIKREGLPEAYILQLQHGMFVSRLDHGAFAVHEPNSWKLLYWDVERDDDLIASIVEAGEAFWTALQAGDIPDRLDPKARQCQSCPYRTSCQGERLLESVQNTGDDIPMVYELAGVVEEYAEAKALAGEADALVDAAKESLTTALGSHTAVEVPGYRVYFRPQTSMRLNEAKVKELLESYNKLARPASGGWFPIILDDLKAPSVSRPLRIWAR